MLCVINESVGTITKEEFDANQLTLGCVTLAELEELHEALGLLEESVWECMRPTLNFRDSYCVMEDYLFSTFHLVNVADIMGSNERIALFVKAKLCLVVLLSDEKDQIQVLFEETLEDLVKKEASVGRFLYLFFSKRVRGDNVVLENIEFELDLLEETIVAKTVEEDFTFELLAKKRELYVLRNYYEQLVEFGELLWEDELELFSIGSMKYIRLLNGKFSRLKENTTVLRENLCQLREAYQSYLDYSLNYIMKVFTVVTTVFSPLSLIVGWYGMNFSSMPELTWKYGYFFVIFISVLTLIVCYWFFKKKKLI